MYKELNMKVIRFKTKITKSRIIRLPENNHVPENEVEILILPNSFQKKPDGDVKKFLEKWAGFLSGTDAEDSKYDYLTNKYK